MSGVLNHENNSLKALSSLLELLFTGVALRANLVPAGRALLDIFLLKRYHLVTTKALRNGFQ